MAPSTAGGQRDWSSATCLTIGEKATGIIEWLSRWNLLPGTTKVVADDAVFNATGSDRGSTSFRTMQQAAGSDPETPWLLWTKACEGLMATWPTLPRHPRDVERIADGCANHSLDAVRYEVQWWRAKWKAGNGPRVW